MDNIAARVNRYAVVLDAAIAKLETDAHTIAALSQRTQAAEAAAEAARQAIEASFTDNDRRIDMLAGMLHPS